MDCRWAKYISEPMDKTDEVLVALPEDEQVSRGQELMSLLTVQSTTSAPSESGKQRGSDADRGNWNVVVKRGFIEVVIPQHIAARRRSSSEPAFPSFDKPNLEQFQNSVPDKLQDTCDASTDASLEAEDFDDHFLGSAGEEVCCSSDGDPDRDMTAPLAMPYHYMPQYRVQEDDSREPQYRGQEHDSSVSFQSWWVPMSHSAVAPAMCPQASHGFGESTLNCDAAAFVPALCSQSAHRAGQSTLNCDAAAFVPQWASPSVGTVESHGSHAVEATDEPWRTTVMIRNMPNNYTRGMLLELVDSMGFAGTYDFAYLPVDFQSQAGLGYAFINFASVADAQACFAQFEGFSGWMLPSDKVCSVTWSSPTQGLDAHVDRYRNSPVMHPSLPDEWKPILLQQGTRVQFPPPTKAIKTPKIRQQLCCKSA